MPQPASFAITVLQHHRDTGPAAFEAVLDALDVNWQLVDVPSGDPLPAPGEPAGVVVLGGTMSATRPAAHPWMPAELAWLEAAVAQGTPVLGVCLGAQLLGVALGGEVTRRARPEIGYLPLRRTAEGRRDPVLGGWRDGLAPLLLHEDEVSRLPPGARPLLAGSAGVPAWRAGSAVAVQFHPEVTAAVVARWSRMPELAGVLAAGGWERQDLEAAARSAEVGALAGGGALLRRWVDREVGLRRPG